MGDALLTDLARAKAAFQQRAILAIINGRPSAAPQTAQDARNGFGQARTAKKGRKAAGARKSGVME